MKLSSFFCFLVVFFFIFLVSCGPSSDERRSQEIQDSIRLQQERQDLIDRANRILESRENGDDDVINSDNGIQ